MGPNQELLDRPNKFGVGHFSQSEFYWFGQSAGRNQLSLAFCNLCICCIIRRGSAAALKIRPCPRIEIDRNPFGPTHFPREFWNLWWLMVDSHEENIPIWCNARYLMDPLSGDGEFWFPSFLPSTKSRCHFFPSSSNSRQVEDFARLPRWFVFAPKYPTRFR